MTRCGGAAGGCTCAVAAGTGITVTGDGSVQTPYTVAASGTGVAMTAQDTGTVDMTVAGAGTTGNPFVVAGSVKLSGDADNFLETGSDGGLHVPGKPPASGGGVTVAMGTIASVAVPRNECTVDIDGGDTGAACHLNGYSADPGDPVRVILVSDGSWLVVDTP